ncbi:MAG: NADH:flavin oxidoreductase [Anaerolineae bacterium]|nr:NADH:flavin oxidoreductase [Anaerolineae bacterium]
MLPIAKLKNKEQFLEYTNSIGIDLPLNDKNSESPNPFLTPIQTRSGLTIGNRFCIHPMEGWDGMPDGNPTEHTIRRWKNFGLSGAKLIWGGEAVAVCHQGRANPNQLILNNSTKKGIEQLRLSLIEAHLNAGHQADGLVIGLQLTHSGRFSKPDSKSQLQPVIAYHHSYLDDKFHVSPDTPIITDTELDDLVQTYATAARIAQKIGFDFVDIKHCHGYLLHELLSAYNRPGRYGGSFENRTRFLREVVSAIRTEAPGLDIGVRLSMFDLVAFVPDLQTGIGIPVMRDGYPRPFGASSHNSLSIDLDEPKLFLSLCSQLDIQLINLTAGSPYYNPHIQRPAMFPPSDGYRPPEDPLVGVSRQISAAAELKACFPELIMVGSAYTYLQEWLPAVARAVITSGKIDIIGIGRMVLSYPNFPSDVMHDVPINKKQICRTFSDCTTAPRCGLISGCYPLDHYYKTLQEAKELINQKLLMQKDKNNK